MNPIPPITVFPLRWIEPTSAKHIDRVLLDHLVVGHLIQSMPREHDAALREYSREELPRFDLTQGEFRIERHSKSLISDQVIKLLIRDQVGPNQPSNPHACLADTEFESQRPLVAKNVTDATQSGPMLLRHGTIHRSIRESSENKLMRSAACVDAKGGLHLIMSRVEITFHALATISIEKSCTDALYLDGVISSVLVSGNVLPSENQNRRYASMIVVRRR